MLQSTKLTVRLHPKFSEELKKRIESYLGYNPAQLALQKDLFKGIDIQFFIEQISLLNKAETKLPTFFKNRCLLTKKAYEQSTSERVATFKAGLFGGEKMLSLTGGLGVDDWAFSKVLDSVMSLDTDEETNQLFWHNQNMMGCGNVERLTQSAEEYLPKAKGFDVVYLDPDRRPTGERVTALEGMQPDVGKMLPFLLENNNTVAVKLSPLFDNTEALNVFPCLQKLITIAENNEVKELLAVMGKTHEGEVEHIAVNLTKNGNEIFYGVIGGDANHGEVELGTGRYFYEPNHALIKSGLWKAYAKTIGFKAAASNGPYLFSNELKPDFQGRRFEVKEILPYKIAELKKYFAKNSITQANISRRNFPDEVAAIRKKTGLKDGGESYLFFTKMEGHVCIVCKRG